MTLLRNNYEYKMDPKGRVAIPVPFRPEGGLEVCMMESRVLGHRVVKVYTPQEFEKKFERVRQSTELNDQEKEDLLGALCMVSMEASISSQGKLTIPKDWAEKIGLQPDGPVMIGGRGTFFMICSMEVYQGIKVSQETLNDKGLAIL